MLTVLNVFGFFSVASADLQIVLEDLSDQLEKYAQAHALKAFQPLAFGHARTLRFTCCFVSVEFSVIVNSSRRSLGLTDLVACHDVISHVRGRSQLGSARNE